MSLLGVILITAGAMLGAEFLRFLFKPSSVDKIKFNKKDLKMDYDPYKHMWY